MKLPLYNKLKENLFPMTKNNYKLIANYYYYLILFCNEISKHLNFSEKLS